MGKIKLNFEKMSYDHFSLNIKNTHAIKTNIMF